jgi:hypothetical protein
MFSGFAVNRNMAGFCNQKTSTGDDSHLFSNKNIIACGQCYLKIHVSGFLKIILNKVFSCLIYYDLDLLEGNIWQLIDQVNQRKYNDV